MDGESRHRDRVISTVPVAGLGVLSMEEPPHRAAANARPLTALDAWR